MTDVKIDEQTGLPELPEGHFWRVHRDGVKIMAPVAIGRYDEWVECSPLCPPRLPQGWVGELESRKIDVTTEVQGGWGPFKRIHDDRKNVTQIRWINVHRPVEQSDYGTLILSRSDLVEECNTVFAAFEARSLYGDYPPKKLD